MKYFWKKRLAGLVCTTALLLAACGPEATEAPPSSTAQPAEPIVYSVRIHTCSEALHTALSALADTYYRQTGVRVSVTLAQGDCEAALAAAMAGEDPPTLLCLHSADAAQKWQDRLLDLTDSAPAKQLCDPAFGLSLGGKTLALAADVEGYGLIYNAALLARTGFTRSDIRDFSQLQLVSEFISGQDMGISAFSSPELDTGDHRGLACLLASAMEEAQLRSFWDLYIGHKDSGEQGLTAFLEQDAIFHLGGSWDYERLEALGSNSLDILPVFTPDGGSLQYTVELAWGISSLASEQDQQLTLRFWEWLLTADGGEPAPVDSLGLLAPYQGAAGYNNALEKKLRQYMNMEPVSVNWQGCRLTPEQLEALSTALSAYAADPCEENWQPIAQLLP